MSPSTPLLPEHSTVNWLNAVWGIFPLWVPHADTLETMIKHVETAITSATNLPAGCQVVIISGFPVGSFRRPNLALLYTVKG